MQTSCKVAFVGAGNMACEHLRAFADVPQVTIVGIHSRTRQRAEALAREYKISLIADSIPELYEHSQADLVVVTVSELSMSACSQACFQFPWTVLLEKPPGYNFEEAKAIRKAAREQDRHVYVALNRRSYSSTRTVMDDIKTIQGPRFIKVQDQQDQSSARVAGQPAPIVENWMFANSIHLIDYFTLFARGKAIEVEPVIRWNPRQPGIVVARLKFDSGDTGIYEGVWNGPGPWAVTVHTAAKRWEIRPLEQAGFQLRNERQLRPIVVHEWDRRFKPGLRFQAEQAVAAALGQPNELPTLEDSGLSMTLINRIFNA